MIKTALVLLVTATVLSAQATRSVTATGNASVYVQPDQVIIDATVTTQGKTAQEAGTANATQTTAVLAALNMLLGSGANIQTINYTVSPNYNYPPSGAPVLVGYSASNTVEVTLGNLSLAGPVIDTATQAGATTVSGLRFTLKNMEPAKLQALQQAATRAQSHAAAMASALGASVGAIVTLQEGAAVQPVVYPVMAAAPEGTPTPVNPGLVEVSATVTLQAALN